MNKLQKDNKGFTIIEVLIVLAIAGLILLIVFLAVPALQRNSRNTQRKNDVQKMIGTLQEAANNNNGQAPATLPAIIQNEQYTQYDDTANNIDYAIINTGTTALPPNVGLNEVIIRNGVRCDVIPAPSVDPAPIAVSSGTGAGIVTTTGATYRNYVAIYAVENQGGRIQAQCINS